MILMKHNQLGHADLKFNCIFIFIQKIKINKTKAKKTLKSAPYLPRVHYTIKVLSSFKTVTD
jgi:hypothetical protein